MDPQFTREYEAFERRHWWFTARRQIINQALDDYLPARRGPVGRWLDVGCGTGVLLESRDGFCEKVGAELDAQCVERGREKRLDVRQTRPDWDFSAFGQFDCVTLCDVLEHVEKERPALDAVSASLKEGGLLLVTVPALMSLWSDHDVVNHHFRRYTRDELEKLFPPDQWEILKLSYFCAFLFPMVWCVRQAKRAAKWLKGEKREGAVDPSAHDLRFGHPLVDGLLQNVFAAERPLLRQLDLPIGSSLMLVARKRPQPAPPPLQDKAIAPRPPEAPTAGRASPWTWGLMAALAVVFTLVQISFSLDRGRLARTPTYDDIAYLVDALGRLDLFYERGITPLLADYVHSPPHSPWSTYVATAAFALFGIRDWAPYAMNALIVFAFIASVDYLMRPARLGYRALAWLFALSFPLAGNMVLEFRPDLAWALCAAMAVILPLRRSLTRASIGYLLAAGAWLAAALLCKTSAFPLTLMTAGLSWIFATLCDRIERGKAATAANLLWAWALLSLPVVLLALPHYLIDFHGVMAYIAQTMSGRERALWVVPGDRWQQLAYFLNGVGGNFMLDGSLALLAVTALSGLLSLAALALRDRAQTGPLLRAIGLAIIAFAAYLVPAVNPVKNPFFGSEFQVLLILASVLVFAMYLHGRSRWPWGAGDAALLVLLGYAGCRISPMLQRTPVAAAWIAAFAILALLAGLSIAVKVRRPPRYSVFAPVLLLGLSLLAASRWHFPEGGWGPADSEETANTNRVVRGVEKIVYDHAAPDASIFLTGAGRLNHNTLRYLLRQQGKRTMTLDRERLDDLETYRQDFSRSDVVIAAEPGVAEFESWLPSYKVLDKTLALLRDRSDFREVGRVPSQTGSRFIIFARVPPFDGFEGSSNFAPKEGPFPQANLPAFRWALYPQASVWFTAPREGDYAIFAECSSGRAGQEMTVQIDGQERGRLRFEQEGPVQTLDLSAHVSAGEHRVAFAFSKFVPPSANDARPIAVMFRKLRIEPAAPLEIGK